MEGTGDGAWRGRWRGGPEAEAAVATMAQGRRRRLADGSVAKEDR